MKGPKTWLLVLLQVWWITCSTLIVVGTFVQPPYDDDFQRDVQELWTGDVNRADVAQFALDFQAKVPHGAHEDRAKRPLFKNVDEKVLKKPTYKAMIDLFKEYEAEEGQASIRKSVEKFLDEVSKTRTYQDLQRILKKSGYKPASNDKEFREALYEMWFRDYNRNGKRSNGFQHVFMGEIYPAEVRGLHNWVRMYLLEKQKKLDYAGYRFHGPRVGKLAFQYDGVWKNPASLTFGTSPEFELAVFTLCFLRKRGENACKFFLGDCSPVEVSSFPSKISSISSAYPAPWQTRDRCPIVLSPDKKRKDREELAVNEQEMAATKKGKANKKVTKNSNSDVEEEEEQFFDAQQDDADVVDDWEELVSSEKFYDAKEN